MPINQRERRRLNQQTLGRLARVCKAFSEPALDVLWQVLDDIRTLLFTLPSFINGRRDSCLYVFSRDITEPEWARFQEYARRVRELHLNDEHMRVISPFVWTFLGRWCSPGQELLPCLVCLDSFVASEKDPGHILLLSSTLRHLSIAAKAQKTPDARWSVDTLVEIALKTANPKLESLRLNRFPSLEGASRLCSRFPHLQYLEMKDPMFVEDSTLRLLATFPLLRRLTLKLKARLSEKLKLSPLSFPRLRELRITGDPAALHCFLEVTRQPNLHTLMLKIVDWSLCTDGQAIKHVRRILSKVPPTARKLSVWLAGDGPRVAQLLKPSLRLHWLTHVSITLERDIPELVINNTELQAFACAWPNLIEFDFSLANIDPSEDVLLVPDMVGAEALILFAQMHPNLSRLVLPYVQLDQGPIPTPDTLPLRDHGLRHLRISILEDADYSQYQEFAELIDALFPDLDLSDATYSAYADVPDDEYLNWYDVEQLLVRLQASRGNNVPRRRRRFKLRFD
ncbi:hypothetical protein OH77DRAFT_1523727 [Trametes cingulata]|nr:hypothetical protein OH77DRAFT_1523727 [Trametes cingulata]